MAALMLIRSSSNPMDKRACNSAHYQYYMRNSNMASSVTMYITGYIILTRNRDTPNGLLLHCTPRCFDRKIVESKVELGIVKWSNFT